MTLHWETAHCIQLWFSFFFFLFTIFYYSFDTFYVPCSFSMWQFNPWKNVRVLRGFDPDLLQTLKKEIVGCSVSCNIDAVMFTHQPTFLLNLIKLTRQTHKAVYSDALLIQVFLPLTRVHF